MKVFLPVVLTAAVVVAALAVSLLTARPMQPPEARVRADIDMRVSAAQSMLNRYDPIDASLARLLATTGDTGDPQTGAYLDKRSALISEALDLVQAALRDGQQAGVEHAGAMRLEAVLLQAQADLLRRQAEFHRAQADAARMRFSRAVSTWREVDGLIQSLLRESGADQSDSLEARAAALRAKRQEVAASIQAAQPGRQQLEAEIQAYESRIAEIRIRAEEAQQQMLALEDAGVDASDPESLERFIAQYQESSDAFRIDTLELSFLESGAIRNARPDTDEEEELLVAPLGPVEPGQEMVPERGLVALRADLAALQTVLRTQSELLDQLDQQIERITGRRQELTERLSRLEASRALPAEQAVGDARTAVAAAIEADRLENQALALIVDRGLPSAARAARAAGAIVSGTRTMYSRYQPELPAPDVSFVSGHAKVLEGDLHYTAARIHAQRAVDLPRHQHTLEAAGEMGLAAGDLAAQVSRAQPDAQDAAGQSPEPGDVPASAVEPNAAAAAAHEARLEAVESAETALLAYEGADMDLKQMWVLHANIAAVHYLLAELTEGAAAQQHRAEALRQYERAIGDRREQPEARPYLRIVERLAGPRPTAVDADTF